MTEEKAFYKKLAEERYKLTEREAIQWAEALVELRQKLLSDASDEKILEFSEKFLENFTQHFSTLEHKTREKQKNETRRLKKKQQLDIFENKNQR